MVNKHTLALFVVSSWLSAAAHGDEEKPEFQYELDDITISIPTPGEPRVKSFSLESIKAAAKE